ncbi:hypothetical protein [Gordonia caeni]|uniref:Uncharacterized protein n=1 Tax=Gordonia caeni TaxID=1007097 RepID=A0ABP7PJA1_9ACTN
MSKQSEDLLPLWTLSTTETELPLSLTEPMTPSRLTELRAVLAALAESPIATLEAHPLSAPADTSKGISLGRMSPLAQELATLAAQSTRSVPKAAGNSGEVLYRMVVPAKVAAEVSGGVLEPMISKAVPGGVRSALVGTNGISAHASFVPATAGAAGGSAATVGVAAAGAGALTVAAPLVLLAVAAGASAHADHKRQLEIEKITALLEKLHEDRLDDERNRLDGCRSAIDKATAILLDKGKIGLSLGLDTAVHTIDTALASAQRRITDWRAALEKLPPDKVELRQLNDAIAGIESPGSEFYVHLELAELAIALKRRVIVLQAVEHAQQDDGNPFESFTNSINLDAQNLEKIVTGLRDVLLRLSTLQLDRSHGMRDFTFSSGAVDKLLNTSHRLRALGDRVEAGRSQSDVAIEMVQKVDGSIVVLPAMAAE